MALIPMSLNSINVIMIGFRVIVKAAKRFFYLRQDNKISPALTIFTISTALTILSTPTI